MAETLIIINQLETAPGRIQYAAANRAQADLTKSTRPGEWSAADVLAHLRACDAINAPRIYQILIRENPPLPGFDERQWAEMAGYRDLDFAASLRAFALLRAELVAMLRCIQPQDWLRTGMHEENGRISISTMLQHIADHEDEHIVQIDNLLQRRK